MLDDSLFASPDVISREVELPDGKKHTLYFKEASAGAFRKYGIAEKSEDAEVRAGSIAHLISASLVDPDGKPAITYERALQLKPAAMMAMYYAILEISGGKSKNDSGPEVKTTSGTS